ncbi:hypothetical protein WJX74_003113 [Apatococcus lobatus]|uniref:Uncharacterized protein n=2 Tax=Apatococcus TaxID=904362 RepID=A0AAW1SV00_9CHLO
MQAAAYGRLSVLSKQLAQTESQPAQLTREDCAASQTILFGRPAYDGAAFAKASKALHLSKDAHVQNQEHADAAQLEPSFGRPSSSSGAPINPQPYSSPMAPAHSHSSDDLPAFSRPVGGKHDLAPPQATWLSKVDAVETAAGYHLDVALHGLPAAHCSVTISFPLGLIRVLVNSVLLGLMLRQEPRDGHSSWEWTLPNLGHQ